MMIYNSEDINEIIYLLNNDKVGAIPCDTIYGLCALAKEENADKIYEIKQRPQAKSFITLMNLDNLKKSSLIVPEILYKLWPCALTAILADKEGVTHAVRVPNDEFILSLLDSVGPIFSTSVNISGQSLLNNPDEIITCFSSSVDFIVKKEMPNDFALPSTLVDFTKKPYRVLRQGSFDVSNII